jgi:hypothetical protein
MITNKCTLLVLNGEMLRMLAMALLSLSFASSLLVCVKLSLSLVPLICMIRMVRNVTVACFWCGWDCDVFCLRKRN